jgi:hypothetical protein
MFATRHPTSTRFMFPPILLFDPCHDLVPECITGIYEKVIKVKADVAAVLD